MRRKLLMITFLLGISLVMVAQSAIQDIKTKGNEDYCIINISRSKTYQEVRGAGKLNQMVYINDMPVCELSCQNRASIKVFSEGKISIQIKYLPNKKIKQKVIDKQFLSGSPLEIDAVHGKTYFVNVDTKVKEGAILVFFTVSVVAIPESESMFRDEDRFKETPEIKKYQEDISNPYIRK